MPDTTKPDAPAVHVVVIGAGPGGYAAAFRAADLGLRVTVVDPEATLGGVCLHRGCIPSKAFLHVARVINDARRAGGLGLHFDEPKIDVDQVREWKNAIVSKLTSGLSILADTRKVRVIRGRARFLDSHRIHVESTEANREDIDFDYAIVATGSRPVVPPTLCPGHPRVITSTHALELADIPERLLVVGGGYIGLELGSVYQALGSKVTLVEMAATLIPGMDKDLERVLRREIVDTLHEVHLSTSIQSLEPADNSIRAELSQLASESSKRMDFDKVLVAVGRKPNSSGIGLENTDARIDKDGFIEADIQRRTGSHHIFAIGDVAGGPMLAHKASHEGTTVAEIIAGSADVFSPASIPAVIFTDPELAWCGRSADQAKNDGIDTITLRFPWQASGRAMTLDASKGLTKIIAEKSSGRIVGAGIVGRDAGELISELSLAIEMGAVAEDLALTIHPHPTLSETVMEAAETFDGFSTHVVKKRR